MTPLSQSQLWDSPGLGTAGPAAGHHPGVWQEGGRREGEGTAQVLQKRNKILNWVETICLHPSGWNFLDCPALRGLTPEQRNWDKDCARQTWGALRGVHGFSALLRELFLQQGHRVSHHSLPCDFKMCFLCINM